MPIDAILSTMTENPPTDAPVIEEEAPPPPPSYEPNVNLVTQLPPEVVAAIGARAATDAETDAASSVDRRAQIAGFLSLYNNEMNDTPIDDQPNITTVGFPFLTRAVQLFKSKLFSHLFPEDRQIVYVAPSPALSPEEEARRDRVGRHMNMQLENEITDYRKSCDRNLDRIILEGCVFEVWYYDAIEKLPAQRFVRGDDVFIPYKHEFLRWDMGDFPRLSWVQRLYRHELEALEEAGYYTCVSKPCGEVRPIYEGADYDESGAAPDEAASAKSDQPSTEADDKNTGQSAPPLGDGQREIIEQDRMIKLPGETRQRKCTVCFDRTTKTVFRVALCERPDMKDLKRSDAEKADWDMSVQQAATMGMEPPPPPAPPKMLPWHRWTQYVCFENPGGAYGHGIGNRIASFNLIANKVATRAIAAMTMNLLRTGWVSRQMKSPSSGGSGEMLMKLGTIMESALTPEQVQNGNGMFFLTFPPPDPQWFKIVEQMDLSCQELTAYNIAAGGQGLSGDTATTSEIRNTNATDNISVVGTRIQAARSRSLWNLAYINSQTLPEEGVMMGDTLVTREDYQIVLSDLRVVFSCDPRVDSQSVRERRAMKVLQTVTQILTTPVSGDVPPLDPETSTRLIRAVAVNALKAMGVEEDIWQSIIDAPMPNAAPPEEEAPGIEAPPGQEPLPGEGVNGQPSQIGMDNSSGQRATEGPLG